MEKAGWISCDGKWYYVHENGKRAVNEWVGQKFVGTDGVWIPGYGKGKWFEHQKGRWYQREDGTFPKAEWQYIDGNWYYFRPDGYIAKNVWAGKRFVQQDGTMAVNKWIGKYFVGKDGYYIKDYSTFNEEKAKEVFQLVNARRIQNRIPSLIWDKYLAKIAKMRAREIAVKFSHIRPNGEKVFDALSDEYYYIGENLAKGQEYSIDAVKDWMVSPSHRNTICDAGYKYTGISSFTIGGYTYWVQIFGNTK